MISFLIALELKLSFLKLIFDSIFSRKFPRLDKYENKKIFYWLFWGISENIGGESDRGKNGSTLYRVTVFARMFGATFWKDLK